MKYLKPKSVTWWTGIYNLVAGIVLSTEPIHGVTQAIDVVALMTGGIPAHVLLTTGLGLIGLRGAVS